MLTNRFKAVEKIAYKTYNNFKPSKYNFVCTGLNFTKCIGFFCVRLEMHCGERDRAIFLSMMDSEMSTKIYVLGLWRDTTFVECMIEKLQFSR